MAYTAKGLVKYARSIADLQDTKFISYKDENTLINESYRSIYNRYVESDGDYWTKEVIIQVDSTMLDPNSNGKAYLLPLPDDFYKLRFVSYSTGGNWQAMNKFSTSQRNDTAIQPSYNIKNNRLWVISGVSIPQVKLTYYIPPQIIDLPKDDVVFGENSFNNNAGLARTVRAFTYADAFACLFYTTGSALYAEMNGKTTLITNEINVGATINDMIYHKGVLILDVLIPDVMISAKATLCYFYVNFAADDYGIGVANSNCVITDLVNITGGLGVVEKAGGNDYITFTFPPNPSQLTFIYFNQLNQNISVQTLTSYLPQQIKNWTQFQYPDEIDPTIIHSIPMYTTFGEGSWINGVDVGPQLANGEAARFYTDNEYVYAWIDGGKVARYIYEPWINPNEIYFDSWVCEESTSNILKVSSCLDNNFLATVRDDGTVKAFSLIYDTVFDYPTNETNEIMAYISAIAYVRKQSDQAKMGLLQAKLTELWSQFDEVRKRDAYQFATINNQYANDGIDYWY